MKTMNGFEFVFYNELLSFEREFYYKKVYFFVSQLKEEYPHFDEWFNNLFENPLFLKKDREIICCRYQNDIVGIAILKKTEEERKICTLRVDEKFQRLSIGKSLMELSFEWLENEKPLITVHKTKQHEFEKLFRYFDFRLEDRKWCYYRMFSTELSYNGELPSKSILLNQIELADIREVIDEFMKKGIFDLELLHRRCVEICMQQDSFIRLPIG